MRISKFALFLIIVIIFILGYLIGGVKLNWSIIKPTFYDMRLIEITQLAVTGLIAIFIAVVVSSRINFDLKRRELLNGLIVEFESTISQILNSFYAYVDNYDKSSERNITRLFKDASRKLNTVINVKKSYKNIIKLDETFHTDFISFKTLITDTPFGREKPEYSDDRISRTVDQYGLLISKLNGCKLKLYS